MTNSNLMKMTESSPNQQKTLWEKEKLLIMSNFFFSHSVFKRIVLQTRKNQGLYGKGLSDQWRDQQKVVTEEKGSPNTTKVHHIKHSDSIYYTLTTHYFQQNPMLLVLIWIISSRRFKWYQQHRIILKLEHILQVANVFSSILIGTCNTGR